MTQIDDIINKLHREIGTIKRGISKRRLKKKKYNYLYLRIREIKQSIIKFETMRA